MPIYRHTLPRAASSRPFLSIPSDFRPPPLPSTTPQPTHPLSSVHHPFLSFLRTSLLRSFLPFVFFPPSPSPFLLSSLFLSSSSLLSLPFPSSISLPSSRVRSFPFLSARRLPTPASHSMFPVPTAIPDRSVLGLRLPRRVSTPLSPPNTSIEGCVCPRSPPAYTSSELRATSRWIRGTSPIICG